MLNETIILQRLITKIKFDANSLILLLASSGSSSVNSSRVPSTELQVTRACIEGNVIPESWRKLGFKITAQSLSDFMEALFVKISYSQSIIWQRASHKVSSRLDLPFIIHLD